MVEVVYLQSGERLPEPPQEGPWLTVEASDDGRFFGAGCGRKPSEEDVFYVSSAESDTTLDAAMAAATNRAGERGVHRIWVQTTPEWRRFAVHPWQTSKPRFFNSSSCQRRLASMSA